MKEASRAHAARTRVAVVGTGFGRYALAPAFRRDSRCEIVAMCARSSESLARAKAELGVERLHTNVEEMLDSGGIDAVAIATPPHIQSAVATLALLRSLPVFVEKLLALSVEDARMLTVAAESAGVANVVDYIFPELDSWRKARSLIDDGFIGQPRHTVVTWMIESHDNRFGLETWKTDPDVGGGALHHFGPHVLHYIEWLVGPIEHLFATLGRAPDSGRPGDTTVTLSLGFASGATGSVSLSTAAPLGSGHRVEIYGSEGALALVNDSSDPVRGFRLLSGNKGTQRLSVTETASQTELDGKTDSRVEPVSRLASRFVDWVRTGRETHPSFRDGLRVQLLLEASERSHRSGSRVIVAGR